MADYASQVLADGATGYWRLGEAVGSGTAADRTGNGQTGTAVGVTFGQVGPLAGDKAGLFDGATSVITITDAPGQNPGLGNYSYELWIKRAAGIAASEFPLCKAAGAGAAGGGGEVFMGSGGGFVSRLGAKTAISVAGYDNGLWHHVVASMNRGIVNGGQFYVDGVPSGAAVDLQSEAAINLSGGGLALLIGKRPTGNFWTGLVDEVAIYNTALSAAQIAAHYALAFTSPVIASVSAGRQYLLGVPGGGVSSGTGPWIALGYRSCRLLVTTIGTGTITAGSVQLEETDDPQDGSGATPMALGTAINCVSVSGNKKACTHLGPGAYGYIRARVSADVVGGGSVCLSLAGMP